MAVAAVILGLESANLCFGHHRVLQYFTRLGFFGFQFFLRQRKNLRAWKWNEFETRLPIQEALAL
jgi:hypothetical protein